MSYGELFLRVVLVFSGIAIVSFAVMTTIRVFILPRGENAWLSRQIFRYTYRLFLFRTYKAQSYEERDRVLALFAPVVLLVQPLVYLAAIVLGYTPVYWALDSQPLSLWTLEEAFFSVAHR